MAVIPTDLRLHKTANGLGGARLDESIDIGINDLFDLVLGEESSAGDTEFRVVYVYNASASDAKGVHVHLSANYDSTDNTDTIGSPGDLSVGINEAVGAVSQILSDESTGPEGVAFSQPIDRGTGLVIGDLDAGASRPLYLRRSTNANSSAKDDAQAIIVISGNTGE